MRTSYLLNHYCLAHFPLIVYETTINAYSDRCEYFSVLYDNFIQVLLVCKQGKF